MRRGRDREAGTIGGLGVAGLVLSFLTSCWSVPVRFEPVAGRPGERVLLLHGLGRTSRSMEPLRRALNRAGYETCNVSYPSTEASIEDLARNHVLPTLGVCGSRDDVVLHVVTHSMGGLVLRQLVADGALANLGRVVMLGPPNGGSEVADRLGEWWLYRWIHGPAGAQLGTGADDKPRGLGPADFELGIIAGTLSVNPILSSMIPGPDDGKVSVESAKLEGMRDFAAVKTTHTFMMRNRQVIDEVLRFLESGRFSGSAESGGPEANPVAKRHGDR